MRIIDTHAHYDDQAFDADREELLRKVLPACGVEAVVNVGATMRGAEEAVLLAERFAHVYAACGIHPDEVGVFEHAGEGLQETDTSDPEEAAQIRKRQLEAARFASFEEAFSALRKLCLHQKTVAVGEIGLDYHWMVEPKEVQKKWFRAQLELARELELPINVHSREAAQDTFETIREAGLKNGGIIHCYSGSAEMAQEYVKLGYHIGIGGVVTFKNAKVLKRVVREVPLEALVTETDSPYLAPSPHRGERNDSRNISFVIAQIAQIRDMDAEACAKILRDNARRVYRLEEKGA